MCIVLNLITYYIIMKNCNRVKNKFITFSTFTKSKTHANLTGWFLHRITRSTKK